MYQLLLFSQIVSIVIAFLLIAFMFFEKPSKLGRLLLVFSIALFILQVAFLAETTSVNLEQAMLATCFEYLGNMVILFMLFQFIYKAIDRKVPIWLNILLPVWTIIVLLNVALYKDSNLYYSSVQFVQDGIHPHLVVGKGILYYINICYYALLAIGQDYILVQNYIKKRSRENRGILLMGLTYSAIIIANIPYILNLTGGLDTISFSATIGCVIFNVIIFRFRIFDSIQTAKDDIVQEITEAYIVVDTMNKVLYANAAAKHVFPDIKELEKQENIIHYLLDNQNKTLSIEGRWYSINVNSFYDKRTLKGYTIWAFDKTDEHESTQKLIELKDEAEKANKAKTIFLANMSHEVRTPMNAIMGMAEIILHENINTRVAENAISIRRSGRALLNIMNDILDFTKLESGITEHTVAQYEIKKLLHDIVDIAQIRIEEKPISVTVQMDQDVPRVLQGNENAIRQILMNLVGNAVKYNDRGTIKLKLTWEKNDQKALLHCHVIDTGRGIRKESQEKLFESFQRADLEENRSIEGTGLGLAISKRLVESMGGTIGLKSEFGKGSTFSFHVEQEIVDITPSGSFFSTDKDDIEREKVSIIAPRAKILVVDDNMTNLKVAQGLFKVFNITVELASGGRECIAKTATNHYDMIFMDQMMPDMDGTETLHRIQTMEEGKYASIPVIAFTAEVVSGIREMFLNQGFTDFIPKPFSLLSIERVLKERLSPDLLTNQPIKNTEAVALPHMEGIDVEAGFARYNGMEDQYFKILMYFYEDAWQQMERMRTLAEENNMQGYLFEAHALKGLANGIGAKDLAEIAYSVEMACREENYDQLKEDSDRLLEHYEMVLKAIEPVLVEKGLLQTANQEELGSLEELDRDSMLSLLAKTEDYLETLEQEEALQIIQTIKRHKMSDEYLEKVNQLADYLEDFEFESAKEIVRNLMRMTVIDLS